MKDLIYGVIIALIVGFFMSKDLQERKELLVVVKDVTTYGYIEGYRGGIECTQEVSTIRCWEIYDILKERHSNE